MSLPHVQLREVVQLFIRELGLLTPERTPCGQAMPISEAHALILLVSQTHAPGLTAKALASFLKIDKSNVSRMCSRMEASGFLLSTPCVKDGRVKRLKLTSKGRNRADQVLKASNQRFTRVLRALPSDSSSGIVSALEMLIDAIASENR